MKLIRTKKKFILKKRKSIFSVKTIDLFWKKVCIKSDNECWEYPGHTCTIDSKRWKIGRVAWIINFGDIPKGMDVRKKCSNRKCVNPKHLYLKKNTIDHEPLIKRFWDKVKKTKSCWLWTGRKAVEGYGLINEKGTQHRANRLSYRIHKGEIPEGLLICHTCHNPECVNPEHLYAGTPKENTTDMMNAMRHPIGETNYNSILTEDQVIAIRDEYVPRKVTHNMLAEKYGVSSATVQAVTSRRIWKHI